MNLSLSKSGGPCSIDTRLTAVFGISFNLDKRYELTEPLGSGAYGVVCEAYDHVSGEKVAIKKIEKAFEHSNFTKRTLRELKILRLLNHDNVISIKTI